MGVNLLSGTSTRAIFPTDTFPPPLLNVSTQPRAIGDSQLSDSPNGLMAGIYDSRTKTLDREWNGMRPMDSHRTVVNMAGAASAGRRGDVNRYSRLSPNPVTVSVSLIGELSDQTPFPTLWKSAWRQSRRRSHRSDSKGGYIGKV